MTFTATIAPAIVDTIVGRLTLLFLLGAAGDVTAARHAAGQMLAAYNAETPDELGLAAEIISLQLHTLEALSDASDPELPLNKVLRLRGSAVSLSRESHKARRKLDQLQRARRAGATAQPPVQVLQFEPGQSEPGQSEPGQSEPGQFEPRQSEPAYLAPGQLAPGQFALGQLAPGQPDPGYSEPATGQSQPDQPRISNALDLIEAARQAIETAGKTGVKNWSQSFHEHQTAKRNAENLKQHQAGHIAASALADPQAATSAA